MTKEDITKELFSLQDKKYLDFQKKLIPGIDEKRIIGIRTPVLKSFAKKLVKENCFYDFINSLPHYYFDENQLHAFILSEEKDFEKCINLVEKFLPYVDNWATCDQMLPFAFKKNDEKLLPYINKWILSEKEFTVRFAIGMLQRHFLDEKFNVKFLEKVAAVKSDKYYIQMMIAWYFATALAKQYDFAIKFIEEKKLDIWVHNKTIQKAIESFRVEEKHKIYLKTLKR